MASGKWDGPSARGKGLNRRGHRDFAEETASWAALHQAQDEIKLQSMPEIGRTESGTALGRWEIAEFGIRAWINSYWIELPT